MALVWALFVLGRDKKFQKCTPQIKFTIMIKKKKIKIGNLNDVIKELLKFKKLQISALNLLSEMKLSLAKLLSCSRTKWNN